MEATADLLRELEDLTFDPALEGCCRRDVVQNIRSGRVKLALQGADRAAARARMQQRAVLRDPAAAAALLASRRRDALAPRRGLGGGDSDGSSNGSSDQEGADGELDPRAKPRAAGVGDSGDAGDADLDALRAARLRQLRAAAAAREGGRATGYGRLNDVRPEKLLSLAEELGGRLVAHLAAEGTQACDHLDEQLAGLAHTYRGTFFCRVPLRRGCAAGWGGGGGGGGSAAAAAALRGRLGLAELPALVAFRRGAVVGRAPVAQFGGGADVIEEEVFGYLQRLHLLSEGKGTAGGSGGRADGGAGSDSDARSSDEDGTAAACELCGRSYPHEHVRAMYRGGGGRGEDDSGSDQER